MIRHILVLFLLTFLNHQAILACSCVAPSTFCESIYYAGMTQSDLIIRGKVMESTENGKEIKVEELLQGTLNESKLTIAFGFCDLFYNDLEDGQEYIIALRNFEGFYNLIGCAISFLKVENGVIKGAIAPGVNRLDYSDLMDELSCGNAFKEFRISDNLQISPNPTADFIHIRNEGDVFTYENLTINIFDASGRKVTSHAQENPLMPEEVWQVDIGDLASGVYFIRVSNSIQEFTYKIVKY